MKYRIDKKNGNELSILGFGCMRFPKILNKIDMEKTEELIIYAVEKGINYFDTAYIYGGSEVVLGKILKKNNLREKIYIATKLPIFKIKSKQDFDKYFNLQLKRLQTDYIDYYLMHSINDSASWETLVAMGIEEWIREKKESGEIKQIGFSYHGTKDEFIKILDAYSWDFTQIQYNYSDENYQAGITGLKKAYSKGIPVIIMEPLLGGKLVNGLSKETKDIFKKCNSEYSLVKWALRWLWHLEEVTVLLSGMSTMEQLTQNIDIANVSEIGMLNKKELETYKLVEESIKATKKIPCTGCNYCMPCPKGVNIPSCFAAYNTSYTVGYFMGFDQYIMSTGATSVKESRASLCIKCGKCEVHCPQKIKIRESLGLVKKRLEPFWYRLFLKIARKIIVKKKKVVE